MALQVHSCSFTDVRTSIKNKKDCIYSYDKANILKHWLALDGGEF